jgi:hypothetical protein
MVKSSASIALGILITIAAAPALGGVSFRLDVGQSFADSSGGKVKDAVLLVRSLACDDPASVVLTGTAEGVVNGSRRSVALMFHKLPTPGVFAVRRQWSDGQWVLNLTGRCPGRDADASAVVPLDASSRFARAKIQYFDGRATPAAVEMVMQGASGGK